MADPLSHQMKGERLDVSAERINAWTDAARDFRNRKFNGGGGELFDKLTPSLEVLIRNDTGANLSAGSVLRVTNWLVTPVTYPFEVRGRPVLAGNTPNATTNLIVILSESIPNGQLGSAVIPGPVAVCDVLVNDAAHTYAQPISGDNTRLGSATAGIARIAAWETSGAVRRAIVVLGDGQAADLIDISGRTGSVTNVTAAQFLRTAVTGTAGATVVTPDDASVALPGDVNIAAQSFKGKKTFTEGMVSYTAFVDPAFMTSLEVGSIIGTSGLYGGIMMPVTILGGLCGLEVGYLPDGTVGARLAAYDSTGTISTTPPKFSITNSSGVQVNGVTGTGGGGDTFTGGICTTLGTGPTSIANVTTGTLAIANGGTGATTAAGARTNLSLGALAELNTVATAQIDDANVTNAKLATDAPRYAGVPASATAAGTAGELAYASGFLYVCVAANTWQRVAIAAW